MKLLRYGRVREWGVIGTYTAKSGILKQFCIMKEKDKKKDEIPWGTLYTEPLNDNKINYIAWKDNALILFISIVNDTTQYIERLRKRPSKTLSALKTARKPFEDHAKILLNIPDLNDFYNHKMGAVDEGNKLKRANTCERVCRRGGHQSLFT